MAEKKSITPGERFGRWVIVRETEPRRYASGIGNRYAECLCDCGTTREVRISALISGKSVSCGCWQREDLAKRKTTHGYAIGVARGGPLPPEYAVWHSMRKRCRNPQDAQYADYGGRGITVCSEWESFAVFMRDMGPRPSPDHSIDRKDNDLGYAPATANGPRWRPRTIIGAQRCVSFTMASVSLSPL